MWTELTQPVFFQVFIHTITNKCWASNTFITPWFDYSSTEWANQKQAWIWIDLLMFETETHEGYLISRSVKARDMNGDWRGWIRNKEGVQTLCQPHPQKCPRQ